MYIDLIKQFDVFAPDISTASNKFNSCGEQYDEVYSETLFLSTRVLSVRKNLLISVNVRLNKPNGFTSIDTNNFVVFYLFI